MFLSNNEITKEAPIFWKSKQILRVCYSSKDVEALNILKLVDVICAACQVEILLCGKDRKSIMVHLFMDSESSLESITSLKQRERKTL